MGRIAAPVAHRAMRPMRRTKGFGRPWRASGPTARPGGSGIRRRAAMTNRRAGNRAINHAGAGRRGCPPGCRPSHPAVASDHGGDPGSLRAEPELAHDGETGRLNGAEDAGVDHHGVLWRIPPVDAAITPRPRGGVVGRERRGHGARIAGVSWHTACAQRRGPHDVTPGDRGQRQHPGGHPPTPAGGAPRPVPAQRAGHQRTTGVAAAARLDDIAHDRSGTGSVGSSSGATGAGSAGAGCSCTGSKMISRRIGPISPARTRCERQGGADDTSAVSLDPLGLGRNQGTFGIGITPESECRHERAARRSRRARANETGPRKRSAS